MIKIKFYIENSKTIFELTEHITDSEKSDFYKLLDQICIYTYTAFFKTKRMHKAEAVKKSFSLKGVNSFPTGLFSEILDSIEDFLNKDEIEIVDKRVFKEYDYFNYEFPYDLDDEQIKCIQNGLKYRRGYFHAVTGAGKTSIIISLLCELGGRSLVLVTSVDLVRQISNDIELATQKFVTRLQGKDSIAGLISDNAQIVVASVPTIWKNFDYLKEIGFFEYFDNVFGDEIHHAGIKKGKIPDLNSYYQIMYFLNSFNKFGFSGTVEDDTFIKAITGPCLGTIDEDNLIDKGRLSKPYVFLLQINHPTIKEFREAFEKNILNNEFRNLLVLEIAKFLESKGLSTMIMVDSKQIQLMNLFHNSNFSYMTGQTSAKEREILYKKFEAKEILILMTTVSKEGINIPNLDCVLRAGANKSFKRIKQEKGRGLRIDKSSGKDKLLIIDFFDDDGFWKEYDVIEKVWKTKVGYLKKQSKKRLAIYEESKNSVIKVFQMKETLFKEINNVW